MPLTKIAIIEDEPVTRKLTEFQMTKRGYEVDIFESPKEFENKANPHEYKGIISDMSFVGVGEEKFAAERLHNTLEKEQFNGAFTYVTANISEGRDIPILERTGRDVIKKGFNKDYFNSLDKFIQTYKN